MKYIIFILLLLNYRTYAEQGSIDTVYSFASGEGNLKGIEPENYPNNIFGLPSDRASLKVPENSPTQILSIGIGGEIIVGFKGRKVVDVTGADFTIFENAFETFDGNKVFAEPAEVSISKDGINFVTFPINESTLENCAGITPTNGKNNPFDPLESGGDSFDISTLGFAYVTQIKIKDVSGIVANLPKESKYSTPLSLISGFDLDAVTAMKLEPNIVSVEEISPTEKYDRIEIYDILGNRIYFNQDYDDYYLPSGAYFYIYYFQNQIIHKKMIIK